MTSHRFVVAAGVAAAAAFLVVISSAVYLRRNPIHSPVGAGPTKDAERSIDSQPLTIGRANALLTRSPSFKTAIDQLAFRSPAIQTPDDSHGALAAHPRAPVELDRVVPAPVEVGEHAEVVEHVELVLEVA